MFLVRTFVFVRTSFMFPFISDNCLRYDLQPVTLYATLVCSGEDHRAVFPGALSSLPDLFQPCAEGQSAHRGGSVETVGEGKTQGSVLDTRVGQIFFWSKRKKAQLWQIIHTCFFPVRTPAACILHSSSSSNTMNEVHHQFKRDFHPFCLSLSFAFSEWGKTRPRVHPQPRSVSLLWRWTESQWLAQTHTNTHTHAVNVVEHVFACMFFGGLLRC